MRPTRINFHVERLAGGARPNFWTASLILIFYSARRYQRPWANRLKSGSAVFPIFLGASMYDRPPDYVAVERWTRAVRDVPKPLSLPDRLLLTFGIILMPIVAVFLVLRIGRLIAAF